MFIVQLYCVVSDLVHCLTLLCWLFSQNMNSLGSSASSWVKMLLALRAKSPGPHLLLIPSRTTTVTKMLGIAAARQASAMSITWIPLRMVLLWELGSAVIRSAQP